MSNYFLIEKTDLENILKEIQELKQLIESKQPKGTEWISSEEVSNYLGVSRKTWQNYRDKKLIPFSQIGRKIWVKRSVLDAFIESGEIGKHGQISKF